jgi:hypothetical protein
VRRTGSRARRAATSTRHAAARLHSRKKTGGVRACKRSSIHKLKHHTHKPARRR